MSNPPTDKKPAEVVDAVDVNQLLLHVNRPVIRAAIVGWGNTNIPGVPESEMSKLRDELFAAPTSLGQRSAQDNILLQDLLFINNIIDPSKAIEASIQDPAKRQKVKDELENQFNQAWLAEYEKCDTAFSKDLSPKQHIEIKKLVDKNYKIAALAVKNAFTYGGVRQRIINRMNKVIALFPKTDKPGVASSAPLRFIETFIAPLYSCHSPADFANYITTATTELNRKNEVNGKRIYNDKIAETAIVILEDLYKAIAANNPNDLFEPGFQEDAKTNIIKSLNYFYNIQLNENLKDQNDLSLIILDKKFRKIAGLHEQDAKNLKNFARKRQHQQYRILLDDILKRIDTRSRTKKAINAHILLVDQLMSLNAKLFQTPAILPPPAAEQPQALVPPPASEQAPALIEPIDRGSSLPQAQPQLPAQPQPVMITDYRDYIEAIFKSNSNPDIQEGLDAQKAEISQWFHGKHDFTISKDNPLINAGLASFKKRIIANLDQYIQERKDNFWLNVRDFFSFRRRLDQETTVEREKLVNKIKGSLEQKKEPKDFIKFVDELTTDIDNIEATGASTKLKPLLINIQASTALFLSKINLGLNNESDNVTQNLTDQIVNKRFNKTIVTGLEHFKKIRESTRSNDTGFMNFGLIKIMWQNGFITTLKERWGQNTELKDKHIADADYFIAKIQDCKSSEDYESFIIESAYAIKNLKDTKREDANLIKCLEDSQERILVHFLDLGRPPHFSYQQKVSMCSALEYYAGSENPLTQKIKDHMKKYHAESEINSEDVVNERYKTQESINSEAADIAEKMSSSKDKRATLQIKSNADTFNEHLEHNLTQFFLQRKHGYIGSGGSIENATTLMSKLADVSGLSSVPGVGAAVGIGKHFIDGEAIHQKELEYEKAAYLFKSFSQVEKLIKDTVTMLIDRYEYQIGKIDPSEMKSLADCVAQRITDYISSGKFAAAKRVGGMSDVDLLVLAVSNNEIRHGYVTKQRIAVSGDNNANWTVNGVLAPDGIVTPDGRYFMKINPNRNRKSPKYFFMLGTADEAKRYGYEELEPKDYPTELHPALAKRQANPDPVPTLVPKIETLVSQYQAEINNASTLRNLNHLKQNDIDHAHFKELSRKVQALETAQLEAAKVREALEKEREAFRLEQAKVREEAEKDREALRLEQAKSRETLEKGLMALTERLTAIEESDKGAMNESALKIKNLESRYASLLDDYQDARSRLKIAESNNQQEEIIALKAQNAELAQQLSRAFAEVKEVRSRQAVDSKNTQEAREQIQQLRSDKLRLEKELEESRRLKSIAPSASNG